MQMQLQVTGINGAATDPKTGKIHIDLSTKSEPSVTLVAKYAVMGRILAALEMFPEMQAERAKFIRDPPAT